MTTENKINPGISILLVDDLATARKVIRKLLGDLGFTNIQEAENGEVALQKIEANKFDLVFMDWNMPKLTGIQAIEKLRADERFKQLPIIMVTANNTKEQVIQAATSGASDYMCKPFNAETLKKKMIRVFNPPSNHSHS